MTNFLEQPEWHNMPISPASVTRDAAQKWLDAYVAAWKVYDEQVIEDLWSESAVWHYLLVEIRGMQRNETVPYVVRTSCHNGPSPVLLPVPGTDGHWLLETIGDQATGTLNR